jgi:Polyketide cyclase / dehydrase and lipid transport
MSDAEASRHIGVVIARSADAVYRFARDPANLPRWAAGLGGSVELVDGRWIADSPTGSVTVEFVTENRFGVLDHTVTLPSGVAVLNPMRVLPLGEGCEVVFTLRRQTGMDEEAFLADAEAVARDLGTLKRVLEEG